MKKPTLQLAGLAALAVLASASLLVRAEPEESSSSNEASIPAAALATAKGAFPGAAFQKAELDDEDGAIVYEIVMKRPDGSDVEVVVSAAGQLIETEEKVEESALPEAVARTLKELLPSGKTKGLEMKSVVVFELEREVGEKTYEIQVDANGEVLSLKVEHEGHEEDED